MKSLVSMTGRPFLVLVVFALTVFSSKHEPTWVAGANSAPNSTKTTARPSKGPSKERIGADAGFRPEPFWRERDAAGLFLPGAALMGCTTPSFAPSVGSPFPAGANPHFAGVGLFNADNHLDVAVPDANSGLLTILLGNGSGGFSPAPGSPITVGSTPITAEVGDFNNDNKADIAVTNQGSNSLTILLGNGDGTFAQAPGSPILVGTAPRGVVKGLLNGDNNLDLVVTNGSSDSISILLGNGNGTFTNAPGSPMAGAFAPFHAVVGKFNGDAINDLAVANLGDGTVIIYLGNGNGSFTESMQIPIVQPNTPISVGEFTSFIAVGLFNADANLDLAVTNRVDNNVVILLGNGNGNFTKATGSPYGVGLAPMGVAVADFNSDGKLDIATSNENSANVSVLLGNGNGGFNSPFNFNTGHLPTNLAVADFNEDNKPDITTPDGGDNTLTVLLNTCSSCPVLTVNPTTITAGTTGTAYSQTFTATGGTAPYSFTLTGTLPTGLSFTSPTLSGTPTQSGSFPITVTATDAGGCMGTRNYTLVINCPSITVNPTSLPNGVTGTAYSQTFTATGGTAPYTFTISAGALPTGLTLASGGALTGTPTAAGSYNFTIKATAANGCIGTRAYTVVITCPSITVNPTTLPNGVTGTAYSQTVTATGGTAPYSFTVSAGTQPTGLTLSSGGALTGTPTAAGTFNFTVRATDANGCTGTRAYTVIISCPSITVNPASLPAGAFGTAYSQTFTATGGTGPFNFALTGTLPTGLSFTSPTLSGTPTQPGSFPITVTVTDGTGCTGSANYTLVINCPSITVNPTSLPNGVAGATYSQTVTASGGAAPYGFTVSAGALPTGLTLASGGGLTGTPTAAGTYNFTVKATDANGCIGTRAYTVTVNCPSITVNPTTIPAGTFGTAYSQTFTATGGTGPYTFALTGTLPTGMSFSSPTLSGTPTQTGSFPVTVTATDANGCTDTRNYTLVINCSFAISPPSQNFTAAGGSGSVTVTTQASCPWTAVGNDAWITLAGSGGTGSGSVGFTVAANSGAQRTGTATIAGQTFTVTQDSFSCPTVTVNPSSLPNGVAGTAYSQTITATGGAAPYGFTISAGALPTGLSLASGGALTGTPTAAGTYNFTVKATDSNGCTGIRAYTVVISCQTITVNPTTLPNGVTGTTYNQTITASGGTAPYGFTISAGTQPTGLTLASGGVLAGSPTAAGTFNFTIKATDANGCVGTRAYAVTINCPSITVNPATIPAGTAGTAYSQTFTATGGTGPYSFALTGTLPTGMSFSSPTLSGTPTQTGSFPVTVTATDANGCTGTRNYTLVINCSFAISPPSQNFTAAGGSGSVTVTTQASCPWTAVGNDAWIMLAGSGGTGSGSVGFTVAANSGAQRTGTATIAGQTFTVTQDSFSCPTVTVNPSSLPNGVAGTAYSQTLTASGGLAPYSFTVISGTQPTGLTLASGGALTGTPTAAGTFNFTVKATDATGCVGTRSYTVIISCPSVTVTPSSLPNGFVNTAYSQTLTAAGGTAPYSFTISAGTQPAGLTLASGGGLTGTPTTAGTYNFTVRATDANGCAGTQSYTVIISGNGLVFYPLSKPVRLMDTRGGQGNCDNVNSSLAAGTSLTTLARTTCEGVTIPATAQAVVGNLTAVNKGQQPGYLTIYPDGQSVPLASNMIYTASQTIANNFTVALSSAGKFNVFSERTIDVIIDVSGYYAPPGAGGLYYHPLSKPIRLLDSRPGQGNCDSVSSPIPSNSSITTQARTTCEGLTIPPAAQAIAANATVLNGTNQSGYVTIYPGGIPLPQTSNINYSSGQTISNAFTIGLNTAGEFNIFSQRAVNIIVDVAGYYSGESIDANGPGLLLMPLARPLRILDTRPNQGNCDTVSTPITGGTSIAAPSRLTCEGITIPAAAQSLLGNVTVINQTSQSGYLTLYPDGVATPLISNMVYSPNQLLANAFVMGVNAGTGQFRIFAERTLDAIIDVSGYFAP